jgi:hypothetical protein
LYRHFRAILGKNLLIPFLNKIANNEKLSPTPTPPAGRGYTGHNDGFSDCVQLSHYRFGNRITPCIPPKKNRKEDIAYDKELYKQRHRIENMFGKLKDWRRIAMRYDRCAHTFFSAICIACSVIFYLN